MFGADKLIVFAVNDRHRHTNGRQFLRGVVRLAAHHQAHGGDKFIELLRRRRQRGIVLHVAREAALDDRIGGRRFNAAGIHIAAEEKTPSTRCGARWAAISATQAPSLQPASAACGIRNASITANRSSAMRS